MDKSQTRWNDRYKEMLQLGLNLPGEPWLKDWLYLVPQGGSQRALDIGCGSGYNTKLLIEHGYKVTAFDFSEHALELCRRVAPNARIQWADIREGLPFADEHFELIVADLSLHYFPWEITLAIFTDIANRLVPRGIFAGRFNSTGDANYGANADQPVPGESNMRIAGGIQKRFFTRQCFNKLLQPPWSTISVVEKTTTRFGPRKVLWEVLATKEKIEFLMHNKKG